MKTKKRAKKVVRKKVVKKCACKHCDCGRSPSGKSKESKVEKLKKLAVQRGLRGEKKKVKKGFFSWFSR